MSAVAGFYARRAAACAGGRPRRRGIPVIPSFLIDIGCIDWVKIPFYVIPHIVQGNCSHVMSVYIYCDTCAHAEFFLESERILSDLGGPSKIWHLLPPIVMTTLLYTCERQIRYSHMLSQLL